MTVVLLDRPTPGRSPLSLLADDHEQGYTPKHQGIASRDQVDHEGLARLHDRGDLGRSARRSRDRHLRRRPEAR
jgi:hypothetical protein